MDATNLGGESLAPAGNLNISGHIATQHQNQVIVIQPGSLYLRIGRAGDSGPPVKVLHAIARRRRSGDAKDVKNPAKLLHRDPLLVPASESPTVLESFRSVKQLLYQAIAQAKVGGPQGDRSRQRPSSSDQQRLVDPGHVTRLNDRSALEGKQGTDTDQERRDAKQLPPIVYPTPPASVETSKETLIGDDVIHVDNSDWSTYNLHWPYRRGDLNLHSGIGGSLTSILKDLQDIWTHVIETKLGVERTQFSRFKVILIIKSAYRRSHIKHLMSLLLTEMNFCAAFPLQEDVAASFGAGQPAACIVDLGDQNCSVSCVEDGISLSCSRISLDYGGSDVTQALHCIVKDVGFQTPGSNSDTISRGLFLHALKEQICTLDLSSVQVSRVNFGGKSGTSETKEDTKEKTQFYTAGEGVVAALGLFQVNLLTLTGSKMLRLMERDKGDSEDPHDHLYLRETSRKYNKGCGEIQAEDQDYVEDVDQSEVTNSDLGVESAEPAIGLDAAIVRSVESLGNEDVRRKMYSNIVLVGGGANMSGLQTYLQSRLNKLVPDGGAEVAVDPKEVGADNVTWRGAGILAGFESAQELWIWPDEWRLSGQRILRERSLFSWA